MKTIPTIAALRAALAPHRRAGRTIGLCPTMGYLHVGHMELVKASKSRNDITVVTIFVNPTQFAANEDLSTYPRDLDRDLKMLKAEGADYVFTPTVEEMYPGNEETIVETVKLSKVLMGKIRPGHFRGVATVCNKLFNIAGAGRSLLRRKGLPAGRRHQAHGGRPQHAGHRRAGPDHAREGRPRLLLPQCAPDAGRPRRRAGVEPGADPRRGNAAARRALSVSAIRNSVVSMLKSEPRGVIEAVDIRDAATLSKISGKITAPAVVLLTVKFGKVRLIDNRVIRP